MCFLAKSHDFTCLASMLPFPSSSFLFISRLNHFSANQTVHNFPLRHQFPAAATGAEPASCCQSNKDTPLQLLGEKLAFLIFPQTFCSFINKNRWYYKEKNVFDGKKGKTRCDFSWTLNLHHPHWAGHFYGSRPHESHSEIVFIFLENLYLPV